MSQPEYMVLSERTSLLSQISVSLLLQEAKLVLLQRGSSMDTNTLESIIVELRRARHLLRDME